MAERDADSESVVRFEYVGNVRYVKYVRHVKHVDCVVNEKAVGCEMTVVVHEEHVVHVRSVANELSGEQAKSVVSEKHVA